MNTATVGVYVSSTFGPFVPEIAGAALGVFVTILSIHFFVLAVLPYIRGSHESDS